MRRGASRGRTARARPGCGRRAALARAATLVVLALPATAGAQPGDPAPATCLAPSAGDRVRAVVREGAIARALPAGWLLQGVSLGETRLRLEVRASDGPPATVELELGPGGVLRPVAPPPGGASPPWADAVAAAVTAGAEPWPTVPCGGTGGAEGASGAPGAPRGPVPVPVPRADVPRALYLALGIAQLLLLAAWALRAAVAWDET